MREKQGQHYTIGLSLSVLRKPCCGKLFLNVLSWVICLIQITKEVCSTMLTPTLYYRHRSWDCAARQVTHCLLTTQCCCHHPGPNKTDFIFLKCVEFATDDNCVCCFASHTRQCLKRVAAPPQRLSHQVCHI